MPTLQSEGKLTLAEFELTIQQNEGILGPLTGLSSDSNGNIIELQVGPKPANRAVLRGVTGASPDDLPGHVLVCTGNCFVENRPTKIAAYRKI
jgi:hypothetical protein